MRHLIILAIILSFGGIIQSDNPSIILKGHEWSVTSLDINDKGDLLLSGSWDNKMKIWDLTQNREICTFDNHTNMIWEVNFSPNEKIVASASWDASINVWDIESKRLVHQFKQHPKYKRIQYKPFYEERISPNMFKSIDFSPDSKLIAGSSSEGIIKIWNLVTGKLIEIINIHDSISVSRVLFDKKGDNLISSSNKIVIYNLQTKNITRLLDWHNGNAICALDIDKSGKYLISGDIGVRNPLINLWDLETGNKIRTYKEHKSIIRDISFSNSKDYFASVGEDNLIILWETDREEPIVIFSDNDKMELNAVCFSEDNKSIIYASQDKSIKIRNIEKYIELQ